MPRDPHVAPIPGPQTPKGRFWGPKTNSRFRFRWRSYWLLATGYWRHCSAQRKNTGSGYYSYVISADGALPAAPCSTPRSPGDGVLALCLRGAGGTEMRGRSPPALTRCGLSPSHPSQLPSCGTWAPALPVRTTQQQLIAWFVLLLTTATSPVARMYDLLALFVEPK
jgi:hypothetical protein